MRKPDVLYLDGDAVGFVAGAEVDEEGKRVSFREALNAKIPDVLQRPVVFRRLTIRMRHVETVAMIDGSRPDKSPVMVQVMADIVGAAE